eukprot:m.445796 g.445796  ORF g.445796 m.445796 type:complete len:1196 (-) comp19278_c0_seq1:113-3700(-)
MSVERAPQPELWEALTEPVLCDVWTENVLSWSAPKRALRYVSLDSTGYTLVVRDGIDGPALVVPFSRCTDVRVRPFDDETVSGGALDLNKESPFVTPDEAPGYFGIAYYQDNDANFKDVEIISILFKREQDDDVAAIREKWVSGIRHLVAWSYPWSPRYMGLEERISRSYAYIRAHEAHDEIPLSAVQDQIKGHQYTKLLDTLIAEESRIKKSKTSLDAQLFTFDLFRQVVMRELVSPAIKDIFDDLTDEKEDRLAGDNGRLGVKQVKHMLTHIQRDPRANEVLNPLPTDASTRAFIEQFSGETPVVANEKVEPSMGLDGFASYLLSVDNDYISPEHRQVFEDMNYPLCAYFCASSHNTFLVAGQVFSTPKVEIYRQSLLSGCRCVEIDIWNGKTADGIECPIVTHGPLEYTHCKTILFRDVMLAIRDTAFVYSEYPVILSFENHCNLPNQQAMARDVLSIFGDTLCTSYMEGDGGPGKTLPSPAQFKRKIIIKNKRLRHLVKQAVAEENEEDDSKIRFVLDGDVVEETEEEKERRLSKSKVVAEELSDLINYVWPVTFKGFDVAMQTDNCYHMSSFNETKAFKYACAGSEIFSTYCQKQLARVYPKGTRLSSSNYNPMSAWMVGAQLVALNYQTTDTYPMQYNLGLFAPNGTCGYRLKPVCMRGHYSESVPVHRFAQHQAFTPFTDVGIEQVVQWDLKVTVLAAPFIGGGAPSIAVSLGGIPADDTQGKPMEIHLRDPRKLVVPRWKNRINNTLHKERVIFPDLALLRINATDRTNGGSLGWECIPVYELQMGLRIVPLRAAQSPLTHVVLKIEYVLQSGEHSNFVDRLVNPVDYSTKEGKFAAMSKMIAPDAEGDNADPDEEKMDATPPSAEPPTPSTNARPFSPKDTSALTATEKQTAAVQAGREMMDNFVVTKLEALAGRIKAEADQPDKRGNLFVRSPKPAELMSRELSAEHERCLAIRRKQTLAYNKEEAAVVATFKKDVKRLLQKSSTPRPEVHAKLLSAEISMKKRLLDVWTQALENQHKLILEQEQQLGKGRLKRLAEMQEAAIKNITHKFRELANNAIKAGPDKFKSFLVDRNLVLDQKSHLQAAWNRVEETFLEKALAPLLEDALGTARNVHNEQKRRIEAETRDDMLQLRKFQEGDARVIQKQFESEEKMLQNIQAREGPYKWESMSYRAYIENLTAEGRLPK